MLLVHMPRIYLVMPAVAAKLSMKPDVPLPDNNDRIPVPRTILRMVYMLSPKYRFPLLSTVMPDGVHNIVPVAGPTYEIVDVAQLEPPVTDPPMVVIISVPAATLRMRLLPISVR